LARKVLLICGIASSLVYVAVVVVGAWQWEGYSSTAQTVSELSALGAPSRLLAVVLFTVYDVLLLAFGAGIWQTAGPQRGLRLAGVLLVLEAGVGMVSRFFPIHQRGAEPTQNEAIHAWLTGVTVVLILLAIGCAASAFGRRFRLYSLGTVVVLAVFGALAGLDGPRMAAGLPTPWIGVTERINIGGYLLWVAVLAVALLREPPEQTETGAASKLGAVAQTAPNTV
jgi:hypothetical protein